MVDKDTAFLNLSSEAGYGRLPTPGLTGSGSMGMISELFKKRKEHPSINDV